MVTKSHNSMVQNTEPQVYFDGDYLATAASVAIAHLDKKATPKKGKVPCNSERGWVGMKPGCKRAKKGTAQRVRGVQRVRQGKSRRPAKATVKKSAKRELLTKKQLADFSAQVPNNAKRPRKASRQAADDLIRSMESAHSDRVNEIKDHDSDAKWLVETTYGGFRGEGFRYASEAQGIRSFKGDPHPTPTNADLHNVVAKAKKDFDGYYTSLIKKVAAGNGKLPPAVEKQYAGIIKAEKKRIAQAKAAYSAARTKRDNLKQAALALVNDQPLKRGQSVYFVEPSISQGSTMSSIPKPGDHWTVQQYAPKSNKSRVILYQDTNMGRFKKTVKAAHVFGDRDKAATLGKAHEDYVTASNTAQRLSRIDSQAHTDDATRAKRVIDWYGYKIGIQYFPFEKRHRRVLPAGYGYFQRTKGADGMAVDVYIGTNLESPRLYSIKQLTPQGKFDEYKMVIGVDSLYEARQIYLKAMPVEMFGGIRELSLSDLSTYRTDSGCACTRKHQKRKRYAQSVAELLRGVAA